MNEPKERNIDTIGDFETPNTTTTTVLERMIILEDIAYKALVENKWDSNEFVIIGGSRVGTSGQIIDLAGIENRIKEYLISDICGESAEGVGMETPFRELLRKKGLYYPGSFAANLLNANALRGKFKTETEIRKGLNLPFDSITTEKNLDVIVQSLKKDPSITRINLVSTKEHIYRIRSLWDGLLSEDSEHRDLVAKRNLVVDFTFETEYLDSEYRTYLRFAKDRGMEFIANNMKRFGLYSIAERFVDKSRKDLAEPQVQSPGIK